MGARDVEMAKPWRHEIYLDHHAFPHPSLRHEISHAIASAFGDPLFGVAAKPIAGLPLLVNPGLVEGLAVALDWPGTDGRLTPHEAVRAMQTLGLEPPIGEVLSLQFFSVSSARGYTTPGSFLRFLFDRYGAAALRALYRSGGDFEDAYGKSLDALAGEWRAMLAGITLPADVIEAQRERYRATSVFARPCPHAIAAARERAGIALGDGNRDGAIAILRDVCGRAPEEPRYRFELGELLDHDGDDEERGEAEALWRSLAGDRDAVTTELRAEALDRLAHAAGARGARRGARARRRGPRASARRRHAPPARRRVVRVRARRPAAAGLLLRQRPAADAVGIDGGDRRAPAGVRALPGRAAARGRGGRGRSERGAAGGAGARVTRARVRG